MEKDVDYDRVEYATNRKVENDEGEETGHIKMFSYDYENFFFELTCPYCQHEFERHDVELGSRPWWIECPECTRSTNVYRIKDKAEREQGPDDDELPDDVDT
ncbi:hypothetical protein AQV86_04845 [Nanohaloarchaea archaeon SG9]|nr:hypothetical protein AQV86_04845 [Nanohaloarchaea archaeon SG9]